MTQLKSQKKDDQHISNTLKAHKSEIIRIKEEVEEKQKQIHQLNFQTKISDQKQKTENKFVSRKTAPQQKQTKIQEAEYTYRKSAIEKEDQQQKIKKLKLSNQIIELQKQILSQESVAKHLKQFKIKNIQKQLYPQASLDYGTRASIRMSQKLQTAQEYFQA